MMETVVINVRVHDVLRRAIREGRLVRIHRGTPWGNPYTHLPLHKTQARWRVPDVETAIASYEEYVRSLPDLMAILPTLKGKALGCFCKPGPCHGDVLIRLIEELG